MLSATTSMASSSETPSCSSAMTRLNSDLDGSGASSTTTDSAPTRLCPARSAEARTWRLSGSCSAKSCRCRFARRLTTARTINGTPNPRTLRYQPADERQQVHREKVPIVQTRIRHGRCLTRAISSSILNRAHHFAPPNERSARSKRASLFPEPVGTLGSRGRRTRRRLSEAPGAGLEDVKGAGEDERDDERGQDHAGRGAHESLRQRRRKGGSPELVTAGVDSRRSPRRDTHRPSPPLSLCGLAPGASEVANQVFTRELRSPAAEDRLQVLGVSPPRTGRRRYGRALAEPRPRMPSSEGRR